jgi:hypothetical protein
VELFLTAENANMTVSEERAAEFARVFSREAVESLSYAFRAWREQTQFFPAISQIRGLVDHWHRQEREADAIEARRQERGAIEQARKQGKLLDFADVLKRMRETLKTQPEPEYVKRQRAFTLRMQRGRS